MEQGTGYIDKNEYDHLHHKKIELLNTYYSACLYVERLSEAPKYSNIFRASKPKYPGILIRQRKSNKEGILAVWSMLFEGFLHFELVIPSKFPEEPPFIQKTDGKSIELIDFELEMLRHDKWSPKTDLWKITDAIRELMYKGTMHSIEVAPGSPQLFVSLSDGRNYICYVSTHQ